MFITIDTFRFVPPTGFADVTGYSFRARGAKELIDVSAGVLPAGIDTLDALLAERRSELELGLPGSIQIDGEGATVLAGLPARTLAFSFSDGGGRIREHWALALDTAESYVQLSSSALAEDEAARARFAHVVDSASWTEEPSLTPAGWVRRWAGKLWLDVPAHLQLPRTYRFNSADEAIRLEVAHFPDGAPPAIESELAQDTAHGEVVTTRSSRELRVGPLRGALHEFTLSGVEDAVTIDDVVRRAHFDIGHRDVHIYGRARRADEGALDAAFNVLVASLEQFGPSPGARP